MFALEITTLNIKCQKYLFDLLVFGLSKLFRVT